YGRAAVAVDHVAVVTRFTAGQDSVAARRRRAVRVAPVAVRGVSIIAGFSARPLHGAVATGVRIADAAAGRARIADRAHVAVVAPRAVGGGRIRTDPARRIADARDVALIERRAHDRVATDTGSRLTRVGPGARVAVGAGAAIGLGGVRAGPRRRGAGSGHGALIGRRAHDGVGPDTRAGLTRVGARARVAVVARRPVRFDRIRAEPGGRCTCPGQMTLVGGGADDGVRADAGAPLTG